MTYPAMANNLTGKDNGSVVIFRFFEVSWSIKLPAAPESTNGYNTETTPGCFFLLDKV